MKQSPIKRKIERLNSKIQKLREDIKQVQEDCPHVDLTYKYWGSSGNYDPSADSYGVDWNCGDCGKSWTTDQDNSYHLTTVVYPQAKRIR